MIETIQAQTWVGVPQLDPGVVVSMIDDPGVRWKRGRGGSWTHSGPGKTTATLETLALGTNAGRTVLTVKGNLPRLLHGEHAAAFTLHPDNVYKGCCAMLRAGTYFADFASQDLSDWRLNRVDANLTAEISDEDAVNWLDGVGGTMRGIDEEMTAHGRHSFLAHLNKYEELAVYSKTRQTGTRGPRDGHLVRLEHRAFGRKAREIYGDTLDRVAQEGAVMAGTRLEKWLSKMSVQVVGQAVDNVAVMLIRQGMDPATAYRMAGPAIILAAEGIPALVESGVSQSTAYRWKAQLDAVLLGEGGSVVTWDDVVYATGEGVAGESV